MRNKQIIPVFILLLLSLFTKAQSHNPYEEIGKKGETVTLTKGEYDEFFDDDSIQRIGSAFINVNTMKVVNMHLTKQEQRQLDNAMESRFLSVDPLASSYPYYTPYQFAGNSPIKFIDLDGAEPYMPSLMGPTTKMTKIAAKEVEKKTIEVLTGLAKLGVAMIGIATQIPAAAEYGNKVPKDQWSGQFPLLPNNNIAKDLVLPIFTSPIELGKQLKENPTNGELWGEAVGMLLVGKYGKNFVGAKPSNWGLIELVETHLSRPEFLTENGEMEAGNALMISRLKDIKAGNLKATETDVNFMNHELTEYQLMKNGMNYKEAHVESLKIHNITNDKNAAGKLYTKEALDAGDAQWQKDVLSPKKKKVKE